MPLAVILSCIQSCYVITSHIELFLVFKASALWANAFYKSKSPSVRVSVRVSVRLFTFDVQFKHIFFPTSRSPMSKIVRALESLGKSNGKKWSQI